MNRNIDLNALRVFRGVIDAGSFTAAAERSKRAVSSISRQIAALEAALGQQLFYRHTRAVSLTEAGQRYIDRVAPLLDQMDDAAETLFGGSQAPAGRLTINAPVAFGERQLVALVHSFRADFPDIHADLRLTDAFVDPVKSGADITFRVGPIEDSGLVSRPLAPMNYVVAAAPAYLARCGRPQQPADLLHHDCLRYQGAHGRQNWYWRCDSAQAFSELAVDGPIYSNDALSLCAAALQGDGLILSPTWLVDDELASGRLERVLGDREWEVAPQTRSLHLLYPAARLAPPKTRVFVEHVMARIGAPPVWDRKAGF